MSSPSSSAMSKQRRFRWTYLLHLLVLAGLAAAVAKYVRGEAFVRALREFDWSLLPLILAFGAAYFTLKGVRFCYLQRVIRPISRFDVGRAYFAGQACSVLPGGIAARATFLYQAGVPLCDSAPAVAGSGAIDWAVMLLLSLAGCAAFEPARKPLAAALGVLLCAALLLGWRRSRVWLAHLLDRLAERFRVADHWRELRRSAGRLLRWRVLAAAFGLAALDNTCGILALALCVRSAGGEAGALTNVLAFALPTLAGRLSTLPAGLGVTDAAMVGILSASPGTAPEQATVAVTVFRLATILFESGLGALVYAVTARRQTAGARR